MVPSVKDSLKVSGDSPCFTFEETLSQIFTLLDRTSIHSNDICAILSATFYSLTASLSN